MHNTEQCGGGGRKCFCPVQVSHVFQRFLLWCQWDKKRRKKNAAIGSWKVFVASNQVEASEVNGSYWVHVVVLARLTCPLTTFMVSARTHGANDWHWPSCPLSFHMTKCEASAWVKLLCVLESNQRTLKSVNVIESVSCLNTHTFRAVTKDLPDNRTEICLNYINRPDLQCFQLFWTCTKLLAVPVFSVSSERLNDRCNMRKLL